MNVNKININQSEQTYGIASDAYDITYEDSNVGEKLSELVTNESLLNDLYKVAAVSQDAIGAPLDISDENGNVIISLKGGHLYVQKFSSDNTLAADNL